MLIGLYALFTIFIFVNKDERKILIDFGKRLRNIRRSKDFTQEKLAFTIGVEISQISRIERGIINTSLLNLMKISTALQVPPQELFEPET